MCVLFTMCSSFQVWKSLESRLGCDKVITISWWSTFLRHSVFCYRIYFFLFPKYRVFLLPTCCPLSRLSCSRYVSLFVCSLMLYVAAWFHVCFLAHPALFLALLPCEQKDHSNDGHSAGEHWGWGTRDWSVECWCRLLIQLIFVDQFTYHEVCAEGWT